MAESLERAAAPALIHSICDMFVTSAIRLSVIKGARGGRRESSRAS